MTRFPRPARRSRAAQAVLAGALVLTPVTAAAAPAPAAAATPCVSMTGTQPPSPGSRGSVLSGVAVRSPCDAWAVGDSTGVANGRLQVQALILHWDGARWSQIASQNPSSTTDFLDAVAVTSATSAWAAGFFASPDGSRQTFTEHWDGSSWTQVASPSPGTDSELTAVAVTSATSAWAVGSYIPAGSNDRQTLTEHWDGSTWTQVASPAAGTLNGVLGIGWAVGQQTTGPGPGQALIEHWDGRKWSVVPGAGLALAPGGASSLAAVSAAGPADIWAVGGMDRSDSEDQGLIEHYDGTRWTQVASPRSGQLRGVSATGPSDVWAVDDAILGGSPVMHYDGTSWAPVPASNGFLIAVSAFSPASVWTVGYLPGSPIFRSLALHLRCC